MKYICNLCHYETKINSNYHIHLRSKKHCKNMEEQTMNDNLNNNLNIEDKNNNDNYICNLCNKDFKHCSSYYRHIKSCKKKNNKNNKINTSDIVNILLDEIKEIKKDIHSANNNNEKLTDAIIDDNQYMKSITIEAKKFAEGTMSTVNFIFNNFTMAPVIEKNIDYHKKLQYDKYDLDKIKDDEKIVEDLLSYKKHNTLIKYLGDIIIDIYKKEDPHKQSIWNSDVSRKNYLLRELVGKTASWVTDKKGIKVNEIVIEPFIKKIRDLLVKYLKTPFLNLDQKNLSHEAEKRYFNNDLIMEIVRDIDDNKIQTEVNNYIAPYFFFDKNNYIIETKIKKNFNKKLK